MKRNQITTPEQLFCWRKARELSQRKAAEIFRRCERMYRYMEKGQHVPNGVLSPEIDDLAKLYELTHCRKKKGKK